MAGSGEGRRWSLGQTWRSLKYEEEQDNTLKANSEFKATDLCTEWQSILKQREWRHAFNLKGRKESEPKLNMQSNISEFCFFNLTISPVLWGPEKNGIFLEEINWWRKSRGGCVRATLNREGDHHEPYSIFRFLSVQNSDALWVLIHHWRHTHILSLPPSLPFLFALRFWIRIYVYVQFWDCGIPIPKETSQLVCVFIFFCNCYSWSLIILCIQDNTWLNLASNNSGLCIYNCMLLIPKPVFYFWNCRTSFLYSLTDERNILHLNQIHCSN